MGGTAHDDHGKECDDGDEIQARHVSSVAMGTKYYPYGNLQYGNLMDTARLDPIWRGSDGCISL
jgi:hypothetical protein